MTPGAPPASSRPGLVWTAAIVVLALTAAVYAPVRRYPFINYDDPEYVADNVHVNQGLSAAGVEWAFGARYAANWHPVTWLSHMADVEAYGLDAGRHHLTNVALHVANTGLLLGVLAGMTGEPWPSLLVAGLFALHPLHVESVAWIAERKDVLSTLCWLLAMWAWWRYVRRPGVGRYLAVVAAFAAGLMAKPMLVTLPCVLVLLDRWPLRREVGIRRTLLEQGPLLALAGGTAVVTFVAQRAAGAMATLETAPLGLRAANALNSYVFYLAKLAWPTDLAVFYPYPDGYTTAHVVACLLLLVVASAAVLATARRRPYLLVGWLWYLGTLVPVIGLVRVGEQAHADRFTYVPSIGIFIMLAWGLAELVATRPGRRALVAGGAVAALAACTVATGVQLERWRDSETLFRHTLAVTGENHLAHTNLGTALVDQGRLDEALAHFLEAVRLRPGLARSHVNVGMVLATQGDAAGAIEQYRQALLVEPDSAMAHYNLGHLFAGQGEARLDDAIREYREAIRLDSEYAKAHNNLGLALARRGDVAQALPEYRAAVRLRPDLAAAHGNLGVALESTGQRDEAIAEYRETVRLLPADPRARLNLAAALVDAGRPAEAVAEIRAVASLSAPASPGTSPPPEAAEVLRRAAALARAATDEDLARELLTRADRYDPPPTPAASGVRRP